MSVRTDTVNLNINVNGNKAQNELNNLRKSAKDINFEMQGLKKGTAEYIAKAKELSQVNAQMTALKKEIGITALTQKELIAEMNKLKSLRGSVIPFSNEYKELSKSIKEVENRLYDVKNGVQGFASFFSKIKDEVKQFGIVAAGYLGFQFLTSQFQNIIRGAGKLSDQLADLQRVAGFTADEAKHLNSQFKELNTRTSTEGLREIAIIAGKLGVAKDDIYDFTAAVDQLVVSLGDELGNAEQITSQLGKILNVFNGEISAEGITGLGNAFVELANSGVATGGFLADFDQRLSGLAKGAGIGLGELTGLGAGLEEMGARVESSTTAIQNLVLKIGGDLPAAAKIAGISTEAFTKLYNEDAIEALLKYSEGLVKNKDSFADFITGLKETGEEGARVKETILKLGNGADILRGRIKLGADSLKENSAITESFALKNETFGATLDKLGKQFNSLVTSSNITNFLKDVIGHVSDFITVLTRIPKFINDNSTAFKLLAAGIALLNLQYIKSAGLIAIDTFARIANAVATKALAVQTAIVTAVQRTYAIVTLLVAGRINAATAAQLLWFNAVKAGLGPFGILITVIAAAVIAFRALSSTTSAAAVAARTLQEVQSRAADSYGDELQKIRELTNVIKDHSVGRETQQSALKELIALNPQYLSGLTAENIATAEGTKLLDNYVEALKNKAYQEAAVQLQKEKIIEDLKLQQKQAEIESKIANGNKDFGTPGIQNLANRLLGVSGESTTLNSIKEQRAVIQQELKVTDDIIKEKYKAINKTVATGGKSGGGGDAVTIDGKTVGARQKALEKQIKDLEEAYLKLADADKKGMRENFAKRQKLQAELDALNGKTSSGGSGGDGGEGKRLKERAEKFYKEIQDLKKRIDKGDNPEEQEIQRATQKYEEILLKAKNFYIKSAIDKKRFSQEEKIIEEEKQRELNEIFQKYFKKRMEESASKEYDDSLTARREFSDQLKIAAAKDHADGKLTKKQYEAELKTIDRDETKDRVTIALDYSADVKKAQTDLKGFRKTLEEQTTADIIAENAKRVEDSGKDRIAKAKRKVLTTRPGSEDRLKADKELLQEEYEQEIATADLTHEQLLTKEAEYQEAIKNLDQEFIQGRIQKVVEYVGYVQQALTSLNQLITNRENAQFNKEKALNNKKRKEYKAQLDHKLISQAQFDKKMNILQDEQDAKERELKRKQAKREKQLMLFRAIVSTAAAVANSLTLSWPLNLVMAVITGALGAIEIAAISSQPLPEAGKGKWFTEGDKHSDPSGGIPIKIERDEAVMTADAMTDKNQYMVRGTPAQITSALNSQAGGVNWAGGAIVKKMSFITDRPAQINPGLVVKMAEGGRAAKQENDNTNTSAETNALLKMLLSKTDENTEAINKLDRELHAVVSIKEYRLKEKQFDASQKLSGLG